jgi:hypothetical protein
MNTKTVSTPEPSIDDIAHPDLDKKWHKPIVNLAKKQVNEMTSPEEWSEILSSWDWWRDPHPWIIETLNMLAKVPAASAYFLAIKYVFYKKIDDTKMRKKDFQVLAARFRRALTYLYQTDLIDAKPIRPEEVGPGRNSVTIWITPFASIRDTELVRMFYLDKIEGRSGKPITDKKTAKQVNKHNRQLKVFSLLDRYRIKPYTKNWYKCPKNHPEGLTYRKKTRSKYRQKRMIVKCSECSRNLQSIPHDEFMKLMKKRLYKEWDLKD